ncbi:hypothetical protein J6590_017128 [Homalodisca vitripennis]|nr:hypothetical protein J6590_017128 [Homalodisca vitripennis]
MGSSLATKMARTECNRCLTSSNYETSTTTCFVITAFPPRHAFTPVFSSRNDGGGGTTISILFGEKCRLLLSVKARRGGTPLCLGKQGPLTPRERIPPTPTVSPSIEQTYRITLVLQDLNICADDGDGGAVRRSRTGVATVIITASANPPRMDPKGADVRRRHPRCIIKSVLVDG